jgi:hypothetical protein
MKISAYENKKQTLARNLSHQSLGSKNSSHHDEISLSTRGSPSLLNGKVFSYLTHNTDQLQRALMSQSLIECDKHLGKRAKFYELKNTGEISLFCSDCAFELASKETQIIQLDKEASLRNFSLLQNILRVP